MQTQTDPTLTYQERLPQVERTFRLYRDRVEIDARWTLGRRFQTTVRLADLSPQPVRFTVRNKWFKQAVLIGSLAIGAVLLLSRTAFLEPFRWGTWLFWPVAGVAAAVAVRSFPKRQFAHFPRKDGRPGLDLCKTDPESFETFLSAVQAGIRKA